jgi:hypothetical protein
VKPGDVIADRFVVERRAGAGGMGVVYRASDRLSGEAVALKTTNAAPGDSTERFGREARLLAQLAHPAIVRYVAHGAVGDGEEYFAMEWLDGEDLAARLARAPLTIAETLAVAARVADGLAAAHARGVVHRDVKPSNIFLVGGDPSRAKVLDFGLARPAPASRAITATGAVIGTVGYMAPEQARGDRDVDARADVFSLGAVLFECLTGKPTFAGDHVVAVLAKVLLEEAPRLAEVRPELPASLDALVARMLAKERAARFTDAGEVARALDAVDLAEGGDARAPALATLSDAELRMVSVVLVDLEAALDRSGSTFRIGARDLATDAALSRIVAAHGALLTPLASGALLVTLQSSAGPRDSAARAASLSLALCMALPDARVTLATGRAQSSGQALFGQVIDRAALLLACGSDRRGAVLVDEVTTALLDSHFKTRREGGAALLIGSAPAACGARTLLGRPTPCVGRDRELALLEGAIAESAAESVARTVLVVGVPGAGKSRVCHELTVRLGKAPLTTLLFARAEAVGAGSALALTRQLLRSAVGISESDPAETQRAALQSHLAALSSLAERDRTAVFLGELLGITTAAPAGPALSSARADPRVMADWLRRSVLAWLAAECAARPVVILLEDAHWADPSTMTWLGEALRAKREQPLTVIAFARPEIHEAFPALWADAGRTEVRLGPLPPRSSARLVREVLGDRADDATVAGIVERADGNAFYLEELIRHVAEGGRVDALPESVLAMAEARLEHLAGSDRRLLRAASVLGETFWDGAVAALASTAKVSDVRAPLDDLARRELIEPSGEDTYAGAIEYRFRHGLLRDAAYATLTEADRAAGHRLAGEWLERAGCRDDLVLAEHAERAGDRARAAGHWLGATRAARGPGEIGRVIELATRGIDAGAEGEALWQLLLDRGHARGWCGDFSRAMADLGRVMAAAPPGSEPWMHAAGGALYIGTLNGDTSPVLAFTQAMLSMRPTQASAICGFSFEKATTALGLVGQAETARALAKVAFDLEASATDPEPLFVANLLHLRSVFATFIDDDPGAALRALDEERKLCADVGDALLGADALMIHGTVLGEIADPAGIALLEEVFHITDVRGISAVRMLATVFLARALRLGARLAEARAVIERGRGKLPALAELLLAVEEAALALDEGDAAAAYARALPHSSADLPLVVVRHAASGVAARAALALRRPDEALKLVETSLGGPAGDMIANRSWLHWVRVEALRALGRADELRGALAAACARIERVGATLSEEHRAQWRERLTPNAWTLALARELRADASAAAETPAPA